MRRYSTAARSRSGCMTADTLRFLMVNEAALRQYGWSRTEILSMSVAALIPPGESAARTDRATITPGPVAEPLETRHLTRDGRMLEVEVWSRSIDFGGQPAELVFAVDVTEPARVRRCADRGDRGRAAPHRPGNARRSRPGAHRPRAVGACPRESRSARARCDCR